MERDEDARRWLKYTVQNSRAANNKRIEVEGLSYLALLHLQARRLDDAQSSLDAAPSAVPEQSGQYLDLVRSLAVAGDDDEGAELTGVCGAVRRLPRTSKPRRQSFPSLQGAFA